MASHLESLLSSANDTAHSVLGSADVTARSLLDALHQESLVGLFSVTAFAFWDKFVTVVASPQFRITIGVFFVPLCWAIGSFGLLRIPVAMFFICIIQVEACCYFCLRWLVKLLEALLTARLFKRKKLQRSMQRARRFDEWEKWAKEADASEGRTKWKENPDSRHYHPAALQTAIGKIQAAIQSEDVFGLMGALRLSMGKNFGGYNNFELYENCHCGTKILIDDFVNQVERGLRWLVEYLEQDGAEPGSPRKYDPQFTQRLVPIADFVAEVGAGFGTTCLFLSGGAALGFYHLGLLRGLLAEGQLPNLICGTSMGAIVLSFLAVRSDDEALTDFDNLDLLYKHMGSHGPLVGSKLQKLILVLRRGYMYDHEHIIKHLNWFTRGLTIGEAFALTKRVVVFTCTPAKTKTVTRIPPMLLSHLTAPNVTLDSAVMASACVPGLLPPVVLQEKIDGVLRPWGESVLETSEHRGSRTSTEGICRSRNRAAGRVDEKTIEEVLMRDGSFESDIPLEMMRALFNVQFSIVSQVNPHIIPFFYNPTGGPGRPIRWPWRKYRGGFILWLLELWLKEDMTKNLKVLHKTGLLFNIFGVDWSYLFLQDEQGDITIVPNATMLDYWHIIDNLPSKAELQRKMQASERCTWRNFAQIKARTQLQRALWTVGDAVVNAVKKVDPTTREAVLRRCGPVHAEAFRMRGPEREVVRDNPERQSELVGVSRSTF